MNTAVDVGLRRAVQRRGLIPHPPAVGGIASWTRTTAVGPITRCVRDAAIYLDVTAGYDGSDPDSNVHVVKSSSSLRSSDPRSGGRVGGGSGGFESAVVDALSAGRHGGRSLRVTFMRQLLVGLEGTCYQSVKIVRVAVQSEWRCSQSGGAVRGVVQSECIVQSKWRAVQSKWSRMLKKQNVARLRCSLS